MTKRLRRRRQRRTFLRVGLASAVGLLFGGGGAALWWHNQHSAEENNYGGLTCSQVVELAPAYRAGTISPSDRSRIEEHLARCPNCGPKFKGPMM